MYRFILLYHLLFAYAKVFRACVVFYFETQRIMFHMMRNMSRPTNQLSLRGQQ